MWKCLKEQPSCHLYCLEPQSCACTHVRAPTVARKVKTVALKDKQQWQAAHSAPTIYLGMHAIRQQQQQQQ